jgi:hypothetical protein
MKLLLTLVLLLTVAERSYAVSGVGSGGVDAVGLQLPDSSSLNGAGIGIGQVEGIRPGKSTLDGGVDDASNSARAVVPAQVYWGTSLASSNGVNVRDGILMQDHAEQVASIMISTSGAAPAWLPMQRFILWGTSRSELRSVLSHQPVILLRLEITATSPRST